MCLVYLSSYLVNLSAYLVCLITYLVYLSSFSLDAYLVCLNAYLVYPITCLVYIRDFYLSAYLVNLSAYLVNLSVYLVHLSAYLVFIWVPAWFTCMTFTWVPTWFTWVPTCKSKCQPDYTCLFPECLSNLSNCLPVHLSAYLVYMSAYLVILSAGLVYLRDFYLSAYLVYLSAYLVHKQFPDRVNLKQDLLEPQLVCWNTNRQTDTLIYRLIKYKKKSYTDNQLVCSLVQNKLRFWQLHKSISQSVGWLGLARYDVAGYSGSHGTSSTGSLRSSVCPSVTPDVI